jgi:hypothetical protein
LSFFQHLRRDIIKRNICLLAFYLDRFSSITLCARHKVAGNFLVSGIALRRTSALYHSGSKAIADSRLDIFSFVSITYMRLKFPGAAAAEGRATAGG